MKCFGFLLIALFLLIACGTPKTLATTQAVSPSRIETATFISSTPTTPPSPTETVEPPQVPGFPGVPLPDERLIQSVTSVYAADVGITADQLQIAYRQISNAQGKPIIFMMHETTGVPLLIATQNEQDHWQWSEASLKSVGSIIGLPIGGQVGQGDLAYYNDKKTYLEAVRREFSIIVPAGAFWHENLIKYDGAREFSALAFRNEQTLRLQEFFWNQPDADYPKALIGASREQVAQFMDERIRSLLRYVKAGRTDIVLANEPFWEYKGNMGWQGDAATGNQPFYGAYGEKWIAEAYVRLFQIATQEFEVTPGKDFAVILVNLPGIEAPSQYTDYCINQVNKIRIEVAEHLNVPPEQVDFDLGLQFHIGGAESRVWVLDESNVQQDLLIANLQDVAKRTGARLHITELDAYGTDDEIATKYYTVVRAAKMSGVVDDITFWAALSFAQPTDPWQNRIILPSYKHGAPYYAVLRALIEP